MRLAVTGTHGTGKTTLIDDFASACPHYEAVPEPYWLLAQQGVPFAGGPTSADLEEQLEQSCALVLSAAGQNDVIFDRCPLDFIAYLDVVSLREGFEWVPSGKLLGRIEAALAALELIVFLPLSRPDEISVAIEFPKLRMQTDTRLKAILRHDDLGLLGSGPPIVELTGTPAQRLRDLVAATRAG
ncbi:AAA family ATPase [Devosia sp. 2618]|uniref:AAA family ATPase n=1 Tax=Devosia sp. 2618 TaxID=3156454 RepID=UPI00339804AE